MSTIGRGGRAPRGPRGTNATRPYGNGRPGADRIYTNGTILTLVDERPRAEALATKGGRILTVGTRDEALCHRGTTTEVVDLKGHTLLPGFVDARSHLGDHARLLGLDDPATPTDEARAQDALAAIQIEYARAGVTTAQDGRTSPALVALLARADAERRLLVDVVVYPAWSGAAWSGAALDRCPGDGARPPRGARLKVGDAASFVVGVGGARFAEGLDAAPAPLQLLHAAVNGPADGDAPAGIAPGLTPLAALRALTTWGARLHHEEAEKGTLEAGKRADLVVLSANPLSVDPRSIKDLRILETIKDGETIFDAQAPVSPR